MLALLPALALLPVLLVVLNGAHAGGTEILGSFLLGAVSPSMDPALLKALFIGLQVNAVLNKSKRARREAVAMLKAAAKKTGSTQLLALAASAGLDAFTKVIGF